MTAEYICLDLAMKADEYFCYALYILYINFIKRDLIFSSVFLINFINITGYPAKWSRLRRDQNCFIAITLITYYKT